MNRQCPCCGYVEDRLMVTGTASPVTVDAGLADLHEHGLIYCNTEPVDIDIPTPASMPRVDRIVLRIRWKEQTVRLAHILGNEGVDAPPMEVDDKILDEPLACCFIGVDGIIRIENKPGFEVSQWQPLDNLGQDAGAKAKKRVYRMSILAMMRRLWRRLCPLKEASLEGLEWGTLLDRELDNSITTAHFADDAVSGMGILMGSFRGKPIYESDLRRYPELKQHEDFILVLGEGYLGNLRFNAS